MSSSEDQLIKAVRSGDIDDAEMLLNQGVDVDQKYYIYGRSSALILAACYSRSNIVKLLLDKGADVNLQDHLGYTALMLAAKNGNEDIIDLLLEKGALLDLINDNNKIAIDLAQENGYGFIAKKLEKVCGMF
jgi:ankyrin repeat protein